MEGWQAIFNGHFAIALRAVAVWGTAEHRPNRPLKGEAKPSLHSLPLGGGPRLNRPLPETLVPARAQYKV